MHIGIAHHLGWAVMVCADDAHEVLDRRRVELVDDGLPAAPIHHRSGVHPLHDDGEALDDDALLELVTRVRLSVTSSVDRALDDLTDQLSATVRSLSVRDWPDDFPTDIGVVRRPPFESQADSVMYREVLAHAADARGWRVLRFDAKTIETDAIGLLGRADALEAPRSTLGAPWNRDHRIAFAATVVAARAAG